MPSLFVSDAKIGALGDRFPHGPRNLASSSGVGGEEESGKLDSRRLIPSTRDIMIPLREHSQRMKNVETGDITKEFIARYEGHPASDEDGRTSMDVIYGDEESHRKTVEVTDAKRGTWVKCGDVLVDADRRATKGCSGEIVVSGNEENVSFAAEIPRYSVSRVVPLNIFPDSSHRDGSIYSGTSGWKRDFHIVDCRESK
ncbi:uncharacterized protein C2845_PM12G03120 [Panicum miliaceum]|uniref:Uncharacterized protein n=1 Tax=Panicum miliaceum TaxID=4540 RepID=A0A3L6QC39_PANMI|nr:uncharacterized protein C2845_PM12G03120 [Panicum miliaceum]